DPRRPCAPTPTARLAHRIGVATTFRTAAGTVCRGRRPESPQESANSRADSAVRHGPASLALLMLLGSAAAAMPRRHTKRRRSGAMEGVCGMRKFLAGVLVVIIAVFIAAPPAAAQDKPVTINLGGGASFPVSGFKDSFDTGFNGAIGATWHFTP